MTKIYPVISLNEFLYALDKDAKVDKGDHILAYREVLGKMYQDLIVKTFDRHVYIKDAPKIIASNNPSLTDVSKLPEIGEDVDKLAHEAAIGSGYELHDIVKRAWARGYKAASKNQYGREDIKKVIGLAREYELRDYGRTVTYQHAHFVKTWEEIIQFLQPIPKEVELEMEEYNARPDLGDFLAQGSDGIGPLIMKRIKVDDKGFVKIIKWIYE